MKHLCTLFLFALIVGACSVKKNEDSKTFRFHLFQEPLHLDPTRLRASNANYFFYNTLRGLYRIDENNQLQEEGGRCQWLSKKHLECEIKEQTWSTGENVTAEDYRRAFVRLIDPKVGSPRAHLLSLVGNANEILASKMKPENLAIEVISKKKFSLRFSTIDSEFLYKLSSTALYPLHSKATFKKEDYKTHPTNGPYRVTQWTPGKSLILEPNPYYKKGHPQRPHVKIFFVDDDKTAFRLFEKKQLNFLRRVPTNLFDQLINRSDFFKVPMLRFDYIGFGPDLQKTKNLRKALAESVDYETLKRLLYALGRPGCPSIPRQWMETQTCHEQKNDEAKKLASHATDNDKKNLVIKVSSLGGSDIKKQAEYLQHQWKINLNLNIEVAQVEQKVFLSELRTRPPAIFRKGVGLDRPTCLSALETFADDSKQNFIGLESLAYQKIVNQMKVTLDKDRYRSLCQEGVEFLMKNYILIPMGEMYFGMMADKEFSGWTINGMNQLDLSQLHPTKH